MTTRRILFDLEADGLLHDITKVHCLVAMDIDREGRVWKFYDESIDDEEHLSLSSIPVLFKNVTTVIGHNIIRYDLKVLKRFYDIPVNYEVIDTLVWSKTLFPDRKLPRGCPTTIHNPVTGRNDKIGPHSLAAWGYRLGRKKVEYFDWDKFDEGMLFRCSSDCLLNIDVFNELLIEAGIEK